jgi:predicted TIM-barrel fold metal-dependent hydrolase
MDAPAGMSGMDRAGDEAIVDTHQHFQSLSDAAYPWLDPDRPEPLEGDLSAIRRDYLPADYRRDTRGLGIVRTVHVQNGRNPHDPLDETRWLTGLADREGMPDAIVAHADLGAPDVEQVLEELAGFPRVRGIRQILNWHVVPRLRSASAPDLMSSPAWRNGFGRLANLGLSFDLQIYWPQMAPALDLAMAFPETAIVLDHFGMPADRGPEGIAGWRDGMRQLARAPNVHVKLSGFGLGAPHWGPDSLLPLLREVIDLFGADRTMVGTNIPVDLLFAPAARIVETIRDAVADLTATERRAVLRGNAERFYRT